MTRLILFRFRFSACVALAILGTGGAPCFPFTQAIARTQASSLVRQFNAVLSLHQAGRDREAVALALQLEESLARAAGTGSTDYATLLNVIGACYRTLGDGPSAEKYFKRAIAIYANAGAGGRKGLAQALHNLALHAKSQGNYQEAEAYLRQTLSLQEALVGPRSPDLALTLNALGAVYIDASRYAEAERIFNRLLDIWKSSKKVAPLQAAQAYNNLGTLYMATGHYNEAAPFLTQALALKERSLGEEHPELISTATNLGLALTELGHLAEAEALLKRSLAIAEKKLPAGHSQIATAITNLANFHGRSKRYEEAESLYKRALAIQEQVFGKDHPALARNLSNLASVSLENGRIVNALDWSRRAVRILTGAPPGLTRSERDKEQRASFDLNLISLNRAMTEKLVGLEAAVEAFSVAQAVTQSSAGAALGQMAARVSAGNDALAVLVREHQDLTGEFARLDNGLLVAISATDARDPTREAASRGRMAEIRFRLRELNKRLAADFPDYVALTSPEPLSTDAARGLLGEHEALVFLLVGDYGCEVFAVTRAGFAWRRVPLTRTDAVAKVASFRRGLDVEQFQRARRTGAPVLFDLELAHELYVTLLGPVESLVKDKRRLIVVPTGALTAMPFHLLVTAPMGRSAQDLAVYREAPWLVRRHALSVLPSVASLKALRSSSDKRRAEKPLIAFGDPVFNPDEQRAEVAGSVRARATVSRAFGDFWEGAGVDRAKLTAALPRLADTADELNAVARTLGASLDDVHLGRDASETVLKSVPLANYRVVYFATHGLVAGDIKGVAEPALALSIPARPSERDDGLLTASEVAELRLNADWVVLSACNTAAGDRPGAEALSGLARSFFYAGARALLVSHWAVASDAATVLSTATFDILARDPQLGRAEALQRAMLAYMNDTSSEENAYPAYWAPFMVIGEGAGR